MDINPLIQLINQWQTQAAEQETRWSNALGAAALRQAAQDLQKVLDSHTPQASPARSYFAGKKGVNRVRLYHLARDGQLYLEWYDKAGKRVSRCLPHTHFSQGISDADTLAAELAYNPATRQVPATEATTNRPVYLCSEDAWILVKSGQGSLADIAAAAGTSRATIIRMRRVAKEHPALISETWLRACRLSATHPRGKDNKVAEARASGKKMRRGRLEKAWSLIKIGTHSLTQMVAMSGVSISTVSNMRQLLREDPARATLSWSEVRKQESAG